MTCDFIKRNMLELELDDLSLLCVFQVDVLESQFSQLLQQINSTRDFESIRLAHDHFLSNLLAQSFILLKPVSICSTRWTPLLLRRRYIVSLLLTIYLFEAASDKSVC